MLSLRGLFKPQYLRSPRTLARRVRIAFRGYPSSDSAVRLPCGPTIVVDPRESIGQEIYNQRCFDLPVSEALWRLAKAGDSCLDVGANIGYFTLLLAARVGRLGSVQSFEPHPRVVEQLRQNVARLASAGFGAAVQVHGIALSRARGASLLVEPDGYRTNHGISTLGTRSASAGEDSHLVDMDRMDAILPDAEYAVVKLDVEGHEEAVLEGAERLLADHRLRNIVLEHQPGDASPPAALLRAHGYTVFGLESGWTGPVLSAGFPKVAAWEAPSLLATLEPERCISLFAPAGWGVLGESH